MEVKDAIELLDLYKKQLLNTKQATDAFNKAVKAKNKAANKSFNHLTNYDKKHKSVFIESRIGKCPDEASAWGLLFFPVYLISSSSKNKKIRKIFLAHTEKPS